MLTEAYAPDTSHYNQEGSNLIFRFVRHVEPTAVSVTCPVGKPSKCAKKQARVFNCNVA